MFGFYVLSLDSCFDIIKRQISYKMNDAKGNMSSYKSDYREHIHVIDFLHDSGMSSVEHCF